MTTPLTAARIHEVRVANDALFWRYPNVVALSVGHFKDTQRVYPTSVPTEDRINDIIDGVPFQIRVDEPDDSGDAIVIPNDEHRPLMSGMRIENPMTRAIHKRLGMTTGG